MLNALNSTVESLLKVLSREGSNNNKYGKFN